MQYTLVLITKSSNSKLYYLILITNSRERERDILSTSKMLVKNIYISIILIRKEIPFPQSNLECN